MYNLLNQARDAGLVGGVKARHGRPSITHLLFVDGSFFFGDATVDREVNIKSLIQKYASCSGQCINFEKSLIFSAAMLIIAIGR